MEGRSWEEEERPGMSARTSLLKVSISFIPNENRDLQFRHNVMSRSQLCPLQEKHVTLATL